MKQSSPARHAVVGIAVLLVGCGGSADDGPQRFALSGQVTYDGQPVPVGTIAFEPDQEKGNSGPGAVARIKDGAYSLTAQQGTVGGPHLVRITAYDGVPTELPGGMAMPDGTLLAPQFTTEADLPKNEGTQDFEVPGDSQAQ